MYVHFTRKMTNVRIIPEFKYHHSRGSQNSLKNPQPFRDGVYYYENNLILNRPKISKYNQVHCRFNHFRFHNIKTKAKN